MNSSTHTRRRSWGLVPLAATFALAGALVAPTVASADGVPPATYTISATPTTVVAGSVTTYAVKFFNTSPDSNDILNQAVVNLPASFSAVAVNGAVTDTQGGTWSTSVSGTQVTATPNLPSLGISPGNTVTVPVRATAPGTPGTYAWTSSARGLIGGSLGTGTYTRQGSDPSTTVTPAIASQLTYVQQPSWVQAGSVMVPAVKVAVRDAFGNLATGYSTPVTLSAAYNPNTGSATNPSGLPVSATPVGGIATFSTLKINDAGYGYKLKASSGSLTPATSNPFDVGTVVKACPAQTACSSGTIGDPNDTTASVVDEKGSSNDIFTLSLGLSPNLQCSGPGYNGKVATFTNQDMSRVLTVTMRLAKRFVHEDPDTGTSHYDLCYESLASDSGGVPWVTKSGAPAQRTADGLSFYGLLPNCTTTLGRAPCLISMGRNAGDQVAKFKSLPGDPKGMFGLPL